MITLPLTNQPLSRLAHLYTQGTSDEVCLEKTMPTFCATNKLDMPSIMMNKGPEKVKKSPHNEVAVNR